MLFTWHLHRVLGKQLLCDFFMENNHRSTSKSLWWEHPLSDVQLPRMYKPFLATTACGNMIAWSSARHANSLELL